MDGRNKVENYTCRLISKQTAAPARHIFLNKEGFVRKRNQKYS